MRLRSERLNRSRLNQQDAKASRWVFRRACGLSFAWPTEGERAMRKLATIVLGFVLGGSGAIASAAAAEPQQARTMDQVIDRVITNENRLNQQIRQYSPLVETYIQNLKPDKDLGSVPAG